MSGVLSSRSSDGFEPNSSEVPAPCADALMPAVGARIAFPPEFGRRFAIFADAEEEFDWSKPLARENTATTAITGLVEANAHFSAAGVRPTYLVDYPVVNNPESAAVIRQLLGDGACYVGTQLHPWVSPPFDEAVNNRNSFTGNLPVALQRAKLIALTEKIAEATGVRPVTYRAGRYGLGPDTMSLLTEAGYQMDVSVRSRFDYSDQAGVDYSLHPLWAWRINDQLIELPLSAAFTGVFRGMPRVFELKRMRGVFARTRVICRVPLTPEGVPLRRALEAIRVLDDLGLQIFSLSFHTPSVVAGHTPYVRDAADLAKFWAWWDGVFNLFAKLGITPVDEREIIDAARKGMA